MPVSYGEVLAYDAIAALWIGTQLWEPQRALLAAVLCSIIRARAWQEIKRARCHLVH